MGGAGAGGGAGSEAGSLGVRLGHVTAWSVVDAVPAAPARLATSSVESLGCPQTAFEDRRVAARSDPQKSGRCGRSGM